MRDASSFSIVLVTAPTMRAARALATAALEARLIACANLVPRVESHYLWRGKRERSNEVLLLMKTRKRLLKKLKALVAENHPYEVPEFLALEPVSGSKRYLEWLSDSVK